MRLPGVHIEVLFSACRYTERQLEAACSMAAALNRGKLVLCVPPERVPLTDDEE